MYCWPGLGQDWSKLGAHDPHWHIFSQVSKFGDARPFSWRCGPGLARCSPALGRSGHFVFSFDRVWFALGKVAAPSTDPACHSVLWAKMAVGRLALQAMAQLASSGIRGVCVSSRAARAALGRGSGAARNTLQREPERSMCQGKGSRPWPVTPSQLPAMQVGVFQKIGRFSLWKARRGIWPTLGQEWPSTCRIPSTSADIGPS